MYYFLKGKIVLIKEDYVVVDVNNVGYQVMVSKPNDFILNEDYIVYTYQVIREDDQYLIGFKTLQEKEVFLQLLKVKGLGPKTITNAMSGTTPDELLSAIASNNVAFLKKLPGLGAKAAGQIILDLKGQVTGTKEKGNPKQYEEVYDYLKELGFKGTKIDAVLATINEPNLTNEELVKLALRKLK